VPLVAVEPPPNVLSARDLVLGIQVAYLAVLETLSRLAHGQAEGQPKAQVQNKTFAHSERKRLHLCPQQETQPSLSRKSPF